MDTKKPYDEITIPAIFKNRIGTLRDRVFVQARDKNKKWLSYTYAESNDIIDAFAAYLMAQGVKPGDRVSIYSNNRPEWAFGDLAVLAIGGVDVTIYPTNSAPEASYIIIDSGSKVCLCAGKFQVDNLLKEKAQMSTLQEIIVFDDEDYKDSMVTTFSEAVKKGKEKLDRDEIDRRLQAIDPEEVATLIYTSGTTGNPKGVMLTHKNLVSNVRQFLEHHPFPENFYAVAVSLLPLSHSLERTIGYNAMIHEGATIAYTEGANTLLEDLCDIRPTAVVYVPRVLEKLYEGVMSKLGGASTLQKAMFNKALNIGKRAVPYIISNRPIPFPLSSFYNLAEKVIYSKLRAALGLDRLIVLGVGGAPLAVEINEFFQAIGVEVHLGYGLTETTPVTHLNTFKHIKPIKLETCGPAFPRTECKIADDGEILIRGPQVMKGYYNKPEETAEVLTPDGWFHTGDIGIIDKDGYLQITDRKKDIIVTAGGKNVAPQVIEGMFIMDSLIEQIAVIGDQKKYLVALIVPCFPELERWAKTKGITETDPARLVAMPEVKEKFNSVVQELNKPLGRVEQIKRFALLGRPFSLETGELTPTLKLKRKVVFKNYHDKIEDMYKE